MIEMDLLFTAAVLLASSNSLLLSRCCLPVCHLIFAGYMSLCGMVRIHKTKLT